MPQHPQKCIDTVDRPMCILLYSSKFSQGFWNGGMKEVGEFEAFGMNYEHLFGC
jgi:hypothetical protein